METESEVDLVTPLVSLLGRSLDLGFNVFDVMHHGTHEKQLSNVFAWLFDVGGTHELGSLAQQIFVRQVNLLRDAVSAVPTTAYTVRQEVNAAPAADSQDIADIVLENDETRIVVENYVTSDGHGHSYENYLRLSTRGGKTGVVVLLCAEEDSSLQIDGWEHAAVVTYERLLDGVIAEVDRDPSYAISHPEQYGFLVQMHRKFAKGKGRVNNNDVLDFITFMCSTGQAKRYQEQRNDTAAENFASDIAEQARERFSESRTVLKKVKQRLLSYSKNVLIPRVNEASGEEVITQASAQYQGVYQWTVNLSAIDEDSASGRTRIQLKFGPSAWYANEQDSGWKTKVASEAVDYSRVFLTRLDTMAISQSTVSLHEVLDGLASADMRLRDEILAMLQAE